MILTLQEPTEAKCDTKSDDRLLVGNQGHVRSWNPVLPKWIHIESYANWNGQDKWSKITAHGQSNEVIDHHPRSAVFVEPGHADPQHENCRVAFQQNVEEPKVVQRKFG